MAGSVSDSSMTHLPLSSSKQVIAALEKDGFQARKKSSGGSHQVFIKSLPDGCKLTPVVPLGKKEIPRGTLASIIRQAGLTRKRFLELLS